MTRVFGFLCQKVNSIAVIRWFVQVQTLCLCLHILSASRLVMETRSAITVYLAVVFIMFLLLFTELGQPFWNILLW